MSETEASRGGTPVARRYVHLIKLMAPVHGLSDEERAARCDRIAEAVTTLMRTPAETVTDVQCKLTVLCLRLRCGGSSGLSADEMLTLLLAESARDDLCHFAIQSVPADGSDGLR